MTNICLLNSRIFNSLRLFFLSLLLSLPLISGAHQTPNTIVILDVSPSKVAMQLQLPLAELELAFGHDVTKNTETLVERLGPQLAEYLKAHIHPFVNKGQPWLVEVKDMVVEQTVQTASGPYKEITVNLILIPPVGISTRKFTLDYDVIMHQLVTHVALISIRNDWELGKTDKGTNDIGMIHVDTQNMLIHPFEINLDKGSWWLGFKSMVALGMQHIKEGTDHLLFLLVLLLPATLLVKGGKWESFGGAKYSLTRLLKIVTAFTVGHSVTLLIGALGWVHLPTQPVEILIAFSILVSAIHAIKPIFAGKEMYVAAGFGLVHGLAFATVLSNLNLGAGPMALSIFGFNLGIEIMQLFVVIIIIPWLILLSQTLFYKWIRIGGAILAGIAAIAWILERVSNQTNFIGNFIVAITPHLLWLVLALASFSIFAFLYNRNKKVVK